MDCHGLYESAFPSHPNAPQTNQRPPRFDAGVDTKKWFSAYVRHDAITKLIPELPNNKWPAAQDIVMNNEQPGVPVLRAFLQLYQHCASISSLTNIDFT